MGRGRSVRLSRARAWLQADGPIWGRYLAGIVVSAAGTVTTLRADLGFSPWDVLHDGARRARVIADETLGDVKEAVGLPL